MTATLTQQSFFYPQPIENRVALLPVCERPGTRLVTFGAGALSRIELLANIIGGAAQIEAAERLITQFHTLKKIQNAALIEIERIHGIGKITAIRIKAALEIGRRMVKDATDKDYSQIHSPPNAAHLIMDEMSALEREEFWVLILDTKNRVTDITHLYRGNLNTLTIRVGEIFESPLKNLAASIIVAHNHPSGDPSPSPEDVHVTERIVEAGKLLDVDVLDHIIIGNHRFISMKERRLGF